MDLRDQVDPKEKLCKKHKDGLVTQSLQALPFRRQCRYQVGQVDQQGPIKRDFATS